MTSYQARRVQFHELLTVGEWTIKVYTIHTGAELIGSAYYRAIRDWLPAWLALDNGFDARHAHLGFLIIHPGREGIFTLLNWWVGDNMLNTHVFLTDPAEPTAFERISGNGLFACVWELAVIDHERRAWTRHVLQRAPEADRAAYLADTLEGEV